MTLRSFITKLIFGPDPPLAPEERLGYVVLDRVGNVVVVTANFDEIKNLVENAGDQEFTIQRAVIRLIPDKLKPIITYQIVP